MERSNLTRQPLIYYCLIELNFFKCSPFPPLYSPLLGALDGALPARFDARNTEAHVTLVLHFFESYYREVGGGVEKCAGENLERRYLSGIGVGYKGGKNGTRGNLISKSENPYKTGKKDLYSVRSLRKC
jgi:hypothetical protein